MASLLSPIHIGGVELKNRLALPPLASGKADGRGLVTDEIVAHYECLAAGGYVQLVIVEHSFISPEGRASAGQLSAAEDNCIEGLSRIAGAIHACGAKALIQLNHAGASAKREATGLETLAPSRVERVGKPLPDREMDKGDISRVVDAFARAARRAVQAGFDGVEIHSAHGYLLNQFYSPLTNRRTDAYGGDLTGRMRIHREVMEAVRPVLDGKLLALRLGACDYMPGGNGMAEALAAAKLMETWGLDLLDVSGGLSGYILPERQSPGYFAPETRAMKKEIATPILMAGGVEDGEMADALVRRGDVDLVGVGRAMLRDERWAEKAVEMLKNRA